MFIRINLWEEFVKYDTWKWQKNDTKYDEKFKITDFLLGFDFVPRDFFVGLSYMSVPISYMYVNVARCASVNIYRWRCRAILPPTLKPISDEIFTSSDACAKFLTFQAV